MKHMDEHKQLELFSYRADGRKVKRSKEAEMPAESERKIPTRIVLMSASVLLIAIISFALGVERGKTISKTTATTRHLAQGEPISSIQKTIEQKKEIVAPTSPQKQLTQSPAPRIQKQKTKASANTGTLERGYFVQVATYRKNSSFVKKEVDKLEKKGYNALIIPSGKYAQVCAGVFSTKRDAQRHLEKLKQKYKDCFIRKI